MFLSEVQSGIAHRSFQHGNGLGGVTDDLVSTRVVPLPVLVRGRR